MPVTLDHAFFPHIIDLMFDFASTGSLFALSLVCRKWRTRSHRKLVHIHNYFAIPQDDGTTHVNFQLGFDGPHFQADIHSWRELPVLRRCRTAYISYNEAPIPRFLPRVKTLRFRSLKAQPIFPTLPESRFLVKRVVYDGHYPAPLPTLDMKKLVVVFRGQAEADGFMAAGFATHAREVVFLFLDLPMEQELPPWAVIVANMINVRRVFRLRLTWVWPCDQDNVLETLGIAVVDWSLLEFNCMSLDEYRRSIGEEEFAIETEWDRPLTF